MREIMDMERQGACPKDFSKVDEMHQRCIDVDSMAPPYFRFENPDTRWDDHPECYWMRGARLYLAQSVMFNLTALHRPYVFNRALSRSEALKASLALLYRQELMFKGVKRNSYKKLVLGPTRYLFLDWRH